MDHVFFSTPLLFLFIACRSQVTDPLNEWTPAPTQLPYASSLLFTGYQPSSTRIYLIGGAQNLIMSYRINTGGMGYWGTFTDTLDLGTVNAQTSVQWGDDHLLFVNNGILRNFDFTTQNIGVTHRPLTHPREAPCLAAQYPNYVYAVGGYITATNDTENVEKDDSKYLQIYSMSTDAWTRGPDMLYGHAHHACALHNNYLYVFGGTFYSPNNGITYIRQYNEKFYLGNMPNIAGNTWELIAYKPDDNVRMHRAVVHPLYNHIYLIGGRDLSGAATRNIQIYEIATDTMELYVGGTDQLNIGRSSPAAILVNNVMYVFGGSATNNQDLDSWEWSNTLTFSPTPAPTQMPTPAPTDMPTTMPTTMPSTSPSKFPTEYPSVSPSKYPTEVPSSSPSKVPTIITSEPTFVPTTEPTYNPTIMPTFAPTNVPTLSPQTPLNVLPTVNSDSSTTVKVTVKSSPTLMIDVTDMGLGQNNGENVGIMGLLGSTVYSIVILIVIIVLCVICMILLLYIGFRMKKGRKKQETVTIQETDGIQMTVSQSTNMSSENMSDNLSEMKLNNNGTETRGLERVASVSADVNNDLLGIGSMTTPFGALGDLLDDNNHIYNDQSGLQKVMDTYDNDDGMYGKGNENMDTKGGATNNGFVNEVNNDELYQHSSEEGTGNECESDKQEDSLMYMPARNKANITTQGPVTDGGLYK